MKKKDIAERLRIRIPDLRKSTSLHVVDGLVEILADAFLHGERVCIQGLGSLQTTTIKAKRAHNISTGDNVMLPERRTVKFKISKQLKKLLNNGTVD